MYYIFSADSAINTPRVQQLRAQTVVDKGILFNALGLAIRPKHDSTPLRPLIILLVCVAIIASAFV